MFLTFIVVLSSTCAFEFTNLLEVQALKKTKYASNLIETLNLSLANKGNVDEIKDLLNQILKELEDDQTKATTVWRELDAKLAAAIKVLKERIAELTIEIAETRKEISKYEKKKADAELNLKQYQDQLAANHENISRIKKEREEDKANTKKSQSDHTDVINVLDEVIAKMSEMIGSVAGVGKFEHINATEAEIRDMTTKFMQIANNNEEEATILMELATSANQDALKKLISLLQTIQASAKKSLSDDLEADANSEENAKTLIASLEADNENLEKLVIKQTANLRKYETILAELKVKLEALIVEKKLKTEQLLEKTKQREEAKEAYEKEKMERAEDKTVVIKLRRIFLEKVENMSKLLKGKLA
jgi:DNA repair exonuclease SbcCD ATPase subunit